MSQLLYRVKFKRTMATDEFWAFANRVWNKGGYFTLPGNEDPWHWNSREERGYSAHGRTGEVWEVRGAPGNPSETGDSDEDETKAAWQSVAIILDNGGIK